MNSVMELLVGKQYPDYTEDEVWTEIWNFCLKHEKKVDLFLERYELQAGTDDFEKKRKRLMELICTFSSHDIQWVFRHLSNFETGMLLLLADTNEKEILDCNMTRRLSRFIRTEAYVIVKKLNPDETMFGKVVDKVTGVFCSEEMRKRRKEEEDQKERERFSVNAVTREAKEWVLYSKVAMASVCTWNKRYEPSGINVLEILWSEGYERQRAVEISNLFHDHYYEEGLEAAYRFSKAGKGRISFMSSGLMLDEEENIVYVTYILRQMGKQRKIYRCTNELASFPKIALRIDGKRWLKLQKKSF